MSDLIVFVLRVIWREKGLNFLFLLFFGWRWLEKKWEQLPFAVGKLAEEGCDVYSGRWVRDEVTRPLYDESDCPYIQPQLTCQEHGRPDRSYQYWRWQPHGCDLPRSVLPLSVFIIIFLFCQPSIFH